MGMSREKCTHFADRFDRITRWRRFMAFIKATKRRHQASTRSDITNRTRQRQLILTFHCDKGLQLTCSWPLITNNNGGMTYQTDRNT